MYLTTKYQLLLNVFNLGRTFRYSNARLVVDMRLSVPPFVGIKHSALTSDLSASVVDLLGHYLIYLSEFFRGGCFCPSRTETHADHLAAKLRATYELFFVEKLPDGYRGSLVAPLDYPTRDPNGAKGN